MKKICVLVLMLVMLLASMSVVLATVVTINDTTPVLGTDGQWYGLGGTPDYIGHSLFEIDRVEITTIDSVFNFKLYTNFYGQLNYGGGWQMDYADLGFDVDNDGFLEYGIPMPGLPRRFTPGTLYQVNSWSRSGYNRPLLPTFTYGYDYDVKIFQGQVVSGSSGSVGQYNWDDHSIEITLNYDLFSLVTPGNNLGIFWGGTYCANDVIRGEIPVPEPTSMLLLGTGLIGLAGLRRKLEK